MEGVFASQVVGWRWMDHGTFLTACCFATPFFVAGMQHIRRPRHEHGKLLAAARSIVGATLATAVLCGLMQFFLEKGRSGLIGFAAWLIAAGGIALLGLPSALLLVHACAPRTAPRPDPCSLAPMTPRTPSRSSGP
jgi:hypothetical protein